MWPIFPTLTSLLGWRFHIVSETIALSVFKQTVWRENLLWWVLYKELVSVVLPHSCEACKILVTYSQIGPHGRAVQHAVRKCVISIFEHFGVSFLCFTCYKCFGLLEFFKNVWTCGVLPTRLWVVISVSVYRYALWYVVVLFGRVRCCGRLWCWLRAFTPHLDGHGHGCLWSDACVSCEFWLLVLKLIVCVVIRKCSKMD